MSKQYSTQGSITIKRLRTGATLFTSFKNLGGPLFQGIDPDQTPALIVPDWEKDPETRPILQPVCRASDGTTATFEKHTWYYNDIALEFNSNADSEGYRVSTGDYYAGYFAMRSDGTLKIIKNLASKENDADDGLTYEGIVSHNGVNGIKVTHSTTIDIQHIASNAFTCTLSTEEATMDKTLTQTTVYSALFFGGTNYKDKPYTVKWYRNSISTANEIKTTTGKYTISSDTKSITITRDGVDGVLELVGEFWYDGSVVAVNGITIKDVADEFVIRYKTVCKDATSGTVQDNVGVDANHNVEVEAYISQIDGDIDITSRCSNIKWDLEVVDYETKSVLRKLSGNKTTITNADSGSSQHDVTVTGGVEFSY